MSAGNPAGLLVLDRSCAEILAILALSPGRGVGSSLTGEALAHARAAGRATLTAWTTAASRDTVRLVRSLG
ncbi:MAG: hypothetical protein AAFV86_18415 [Pseudomonadota bacterium]